MMNDGSLDRAVMSIPHIGGICKTTIYMEVYNDEYYRY